MYEHNESQMVMPDEFFLPFGGKLNLDNRWVKLAQLIPWEKAEEAYIQSLKDTSQGNKAYSIRKALGTLIIKERMNWSDAETVEQIKENPYLQYFIGLSAFQEKAPFDASLITHFRKRLDASIINQVNEWIVEAQSQQTKDQQSEQDNDHDDDDSHGGEAANDTPVSQPEDQAESSSHQGKLLIDATCAPADITYPTDLGLLNDAREKLEAMIDTLHLPHQGEQPKARTYRKKARKAYLAVAKQRNPRRKTLRKAVGKQLNFVERDLKHVEALVRQDGLKALRNSQYRHLLVIQELFRQQKIMHKTRTHRIDNRIVSISQPHIRPIVRGKTGAQVEFGSKLSVSLVNGFSFLDKLGWNAYHEGNDLCQSIEAYHRRYGVYPEAVLADQIYRTRENRAYCKKLGIRMSGPKLGRPSKDADVNAREKQIAYQDAVERNPIEGKFGEGKRKYSLDRIFARLQKTSEAVISLQFLVMNLEKILRDSFLPFFQSWIIKLFILDEKQPTVILEK